MKIILLFLMILILPKVANATAQFGDILIWKGDTLTLFSNPLHSHPGWSDLFNKIVIEFENEAKRLFPEIYGAEEDPMLFSTTCNRGYIAEWKIINDSLFLTNILACHHRQVKIDLNKMFNIASDDGFLFADWVTDELIVPKGELIEFVNLGYNRIFETEIVLEISSGVLANERLYSNFIKSRSEFASAENPNTILEFIYSRIAWEDLPDLKNRNILVRIGIQPDATGQIERILPEYTFMIDGNEVVSDLSNEFIMEAIRIAELIPDWDVVYRRGTIVRRGIGIHFSNEMRMRYAPQQ
ncbi:MAG TPA: hypothetical protein VLH37_01785 [Bacteroidales bacterium]|nr:hypothetical protein [Bacteroidales bacterium]